MTATRTASKSAAAFRTISEVSQHLEVPQHVLRFWETKFAQVRPLKRGGGRRYYRPEDVALLRQIQRLLHRDGYTIRGAQQVLRQKPRKASQTADAPADAERTVDDDRKGAQLDPAVRAELRAVLDELKALRRLLGAGHG